MNLRRRMLPPGWYPDDPEGVLGLVAEWSRSRAPKIGAIAAIAPHAGWAYSGSIAHLGIRSLGDAETIAVIGGHLPGSSPPLAATEEAFETPLGAIMADVELKAALFASLAERKPRGPALAADDRPDNTVEVQLPLVKALFPQARLLWLRAPNGQSALALGAALAEAAGKLGRKLACIGSTDLTHYGPAYGFSPAGRGEAAERWVRERNDKAFLQAILSMDASAVVERGEEDRSACSSGAAAAALAFALGSGAKRAELLGYATSLDTRKDESFVGYAAVGFYGD